MILKKNRICTSANLSNHNEDRSVKKDDDDDDDGVIHDDDDDEDGVIYDDDNDDDDDRKSGSGSQWLAIKHQQIPLFDDHIHDDNSD